MQIIKPLRARLNAHKGTGMWGVLADRAGCHYFTLARVARGAIDPGCALAERLFAALDRVESCHKRLSAKRREG